jgi:hypothetical protein
MPAALSLSSSTAAVALTLLLSIIRSVSSVLIGDTDLQRFLQPNSNVTILNDGAVHTINEKFNGESFYVRNTTLILENGGGILATENWPGIRLVTSSTLNMTGGSVQGWHDKPAVELHNGQSNIDTASFAEIYGGSIVGGKSSDGVGGDAFYVHGFGTQAKIFAGQFIGGIGQDGVIDGLSIAVQNFASVHIHSGTFQGEMEVGTGSNIAFYGCFLQSGTTIAGEFVDGTELNVVVKTKNGGKILLIAVSEQECETQPSMQPTSFPTISPRPTPQISYGEKKTQSLSLVIASTLLAILLPGLP